MTHDIRHVAVVGAGGMGALFGAILCEGGLEVTLVDTDHEHMDACLLYTSDAADD